MADALVLAAEASWVSAGAAAASLLLLEEEEEEEEEEEGTSSGTASGPNRFCMKSLCEVRCSHIVFCSVYLGLMIAM
jgi:hypothetical protein